MSRLIRHVALLLLGLFGVVWAFTWGANPTIVCRDVVMQPGDVCTNAEGTRTQTYEERFAAAQAARPVMGIVGGVVAAFAGGLIVLDRRQGRPEG